MDPNNLQVQQLIHQQQQQQSQQNQQSGFVTYGPAFISPHPNLMYARDVPQFYQAGLGQEFQVPYSVAPAEKPAAVAPAAMAKDSEAPAAKAPKTGKKGGDKSGSTYASRHQAAESRRRQRINDRLDILRKVVPHRDRANTAAFLEEVIAYVLGLKKRLAEVEGVAEDNITVPTVDVQPILYGSAIPSAAPSTAAVLGSPTPTGAAPAAMDTAAMAMAATAPMQAMAAQGAVLPQMMAGQAMPAAVDAQKSMMAARGMPTPAMHSNQVLVPVALMQPDQGTVGGQAYMLVNREEFPNMMMPQAQTPGELHKPGGEAGLMDVLVGAANRVEGGHTDATGDDGEDGLDDESKAVEKQPLVTRSGRKRNPSRSF